MKVSVLGIDLGKNICSIVGLDETGAVVLRRQVKRKTLIGLAAKLSPCIVAMEACCGAHYLGRLIADQGHDVRLMSPEYVRPYIKAQKNDDRDAEGICRSGEPADHALCRGQDARNSKRAQCCFGRGSFWCASARN